MENTKPTRLIREVKRWQIFISFVRIISWTNSKSCVSGLITRIVKEKEND